MIELFFLISDSALSSSRRHISFNCTHLKKKRKRKSECFKGNIKPWHWPLHSGLSKKYLTTLAGLHFNHVVSMPGEGEKSQNSQKIKPHFGMGLLLRFLPACELELRRQHRPNGLKLFRGLLCLQNRDRASSSLTSGHPTRHQRVSPSWRTTGGRRGFLQGMQHTVSPMTVGSWLKTGFPESALWGTGRGRVSFCRNANSLCHIRLLTHRNFSCPKEGWALPQCLLLRPNY